VSIFVKICGMTDEEAVAAAVEAGADAVGFVFYEKSSRNVSIERAAELAGLVPEGILKVAVTLRPREHWWTDIVEGLRPDAIQADIDDFAFMRGGEGIAKWPVVREGSDPHGLPELYVYEGRKSGQGQAVDWQIAASYARQGRMILAGGLSADNVGEAIATVRPFGVDVSSAVESAPGVKDPAKIVTFIEAARAAG
jgi:phosphoribosylanthranilate isomerase